MLTVPGNLGFKTTKEEVQAHFTEAAGMFFLAGVASHLCQATSQQSDC